MSSAYCAWLIGDTNWLQFFAVLAILRKATGTGREDAIRLFQFKSTTDHVLPKDKSAVRYRCVVPGFLPALAVAASLLSFVKRGINPFIITLV